MFLRDRQHGVTVRASVRSAEQQSNSYAVPNAVISADGRFIASALSPRTYSRTSAPAFFLFLTLAGVAVEDFEQLMAAAGARSLFSMAPQTGVEPAAYLLENEISRVEHDRGSANRKSINNLAPAALPSHTPVREAVIGPLRRAPPGASSRQQLGAQA